MLGVEIMEAMTWVAALTYNDNMNFQDGLNCKSFIKKKGPMGVGNESLLQEYKR